MNREKRCVHVSESEFVRLAGFTLIGQLELG